MFTNRGESYGLAPSVLVVLALLSPLALASSAIQEEELESAKAAFEQNDWQSAEGHLRRYLDGNDGDQEAYALLGDVLYARSQEALSAPFGGASIASAYGVEAQDAWSKAIELGDQRAPTYLSLAISLRDSGEYKRSLDVTQRGLEKTPSIDFRWLLADLNKRLGDFKKAEEWALGVLEDKELDQATTKLECALIALESQLKRDQWDRTQELLKSLEAAQQDIIREQGLDPATADSQLCWRLWNIFGVYGNFDGSAKLYEATSQVLSESLWTWFYLGASRRRGGQFEEAILPLEKALELDSSMSAIHLELGLAHFGREEFSLAFESLREAAEKDQARETTSLDDLMVLGRFVAGRFDFQLAESCFALVRQLDPGRAVAASNLALVQRQSGAYEKSLEIYGQAVADFPEQTSLVNDQGLVHFGRGNLAQAIPLFRQAAALDQIDAHENLAMIAWQSGDAETAILHLKKVLSLNSQRTKARFYFEKVKRAVQDNS